MATKVTQDREVNSVSKVSGEHTTSTLYYGSPYGKPSTIQVPAMGTHRVRKPTGGKALPRREKAFENGILTYRFPYGTLHRVDGAYETKTEGYHSGIFNMYKGNNLRCTMAYPMKSSYTRVPPVVDQYPPAVNTDLLSQAEVKCLNKLRGKSAEDELEFGLVWAERHETVKLFADMCTGLLKLALCLKRGDVAAAVDVFLNDFKLTHVQGRASRRRIERQMEKGFRSTKNLFKRMSDAVLLWNLGISPLLKDLESAAQLLKTGLLTKDWDIKSVSRHSRTIQDVETDSWSTARVTQTFYENHGYTVTLIGQPVFTTRALFGRLGLTNLPNLAYQSTSLTFILDYAWAIGPWLQAIEVPSLFEFKDGSKTQRVERLIQLEVSSLSGKPMKGEAVLNYVKRTVYGSFPLPLPPLSLRGKQFTDKQVLNTGLVAMNRLRGLLK